MTAQTTDLPVALPRTTHAPIPFGRLVAVELRKMFDTRSGLWLMVGIVVSAVLATAAVIAFAPEAEQTYASFGAAVGFPMAVLLPIVAILSVTSEWSQRSGLTTFTLVPGRGRVITAKAVGTVLVGVASMLVAFVVGAMGNVVGTAIAGTDLVWDMGWTDLWHIVLGNVLGMMVGFMLGVLIRSSAGAIVGYFVYSLVLPSLTGLLAAFQDWFRDLQPWVDFQYAQSGLFEGVMTREEWAQLAVSGTVWLVLPLTVGLIMLSRSEVK